MFLQIRSAIGMRCFPPSGSFFPRCLKVFGCPLVDLNATRANASPPFYVSPVADPMAWKEDAFQHSWNSLYFYAFPLLALLRQVLLRVVIFRNLSVILVALFGLRRN